MTLFRQLFDRESSTYTYLLGDPESGQAILIDPVREQVDRDLGLLEELGLELALTLETHVHADHVAGSGVLRERVGSRSVLSKQAGAECADVLVDDGDVVRVGALELEVRLTPGHTRGCASYVDHAGERVFTGDTLLVRGCGRTDFQQGDAATLYRSVTQKLFTLPDRFAVYPGHDYRGRTRSSIGEEKAHNPRLGGGRSEAEFLDLMAKLDLAEPKKIAEAVPLNLACGLGPWAPVERAGGIPEVEVPWTLANAARVKVVDVRELHELSGPLGRFEGAVHVPLGSLSEVAEGWERDETIVVICRSGGRSGRAALVLEGMGFERVASMRGGMIEVRQAGAQAAACG